MIAWITLIAGTAVAACAMFFVRAAPRAWSVGLVALAAVVALSGAFGGVAVFVVVALCAVAVLLLENAALRRAWLSDRLFAWYKTVLPQVSRTEQEALDAGTVWWDGQLFTGRPDWGRLFAYPKPTLSETERAFIDGPTEQLCAMLDDWKITHELYDLPPEVWSFIREQGFLGMIIPRRYGGLEFSALAHSEVVMKLSTRCSAAAVSVMVPNSLGPAELLLHYGTDAQKEHYLPRLARGIDLPCFALTGPEAGSDAGSIPDRGIVCRGDFDGRSDVLGIRVTWEKRYITLAPVATLLGLAFRLYDPDRLLGGEEDIGITLALIPTDTQGVQIGRRHLPLNGVFQNGPTSGRDVFIPIDWVIGGAERCGHGWRMLMECLAAGRAISLPAQSVAAAKLAARATGGYARVRNQFGMPIGRFEGIEEALARIGGNAYAMDAARTMTAGAVDLGEKPSVPSAIVKYHLTERMRSVINDAMDVHGGKGICLGPNNYLGRAYQLVPVGITVEGANILTRSMIIFGQGAVRCHPYVMREIAATREPDARHAAEAFDQAFWGHVGFTLGNGARSLVLGLTGARGADVPGARSVRREFQQIDRYAAAFALLADVSMLALGGSLKRREKISARLGDVLSMLYLASAALKRWHDQGQPEADLPLLRWVLQDCLARIESAIDGILENFPIGVLRRALRLVVMPLGRSCSPPSDELGHEVAAMLIAPSEARDRLTQGMYCPEREADAVGRIELALRATVEAEPVLARIRTAQRDGTLAAVGPEQVALKALETGIITMKEHELVRRQRALMRAVVDVDDFSRMFGREQAEWQAQQPRAAAGR